MEFVEGQGLGWHPVGDDATENHTDGAKVLSEVHHVGNGAETTLSHVLPGGHSDAGRSTVQRIWADENSIKATATAEKDARQTCSSAATMANPSAAHSSSKFEWSETSDTVTIGTEDSG